MTTRTTPKKLASKTAAYLKPTRTGDSKSPAKAAAGVIDRGKASRKAALGVAKSLAAGDSPVKAAVAGGASALKEVGARMLGKKNEGGSGNKVKITNIIEEVDVGAPRRLVYDQWTQFQKFPSFMKKVENTEQV